jgi:hypothetical protein
VLSKVVAVAGGNRLTFALRTDGILWATGGRGFGENRKFDDYDNKKRTLFRRDLTDVTAFATSWDSYGTFEGFSLAIKKDGTVWGYGNDGWACLAEACLISRSGQSCTMINAGSLDGRAVLLWAVPGNNLEKPKDKIRPYGSVLGR